jgi:hypothetical protein
MAASPRYLDLMTDTTYHSYAPHTEAEAWRELTRTWKTLQRKIDFNPSNHLRTIANLTMCLIEWNSTLSREQIAAKAVAIHTAKNAGYAGIDNPDPWANFRGAEAFGVTPYIGCMIRLGDKMLRLQNLRDNDENDLANEPITETLWDTMAYALISICLYEEKHDLRPK